MIFSDPNNYLTLWKGVVMGLAAIFLVAGAAHLIKPAMFHRIMPPWIRKWKVGVNYLTGAAEMICAVALLFGDTRQVAAWGIVVILIVVFPANVYMLQDERASLGLPAWVLWARLPLQVMLILAALWIALT